MPPGQWALLRSWYQAEAEKQEMEIMNKFAVKFLSLRFDLKNIIKPK